MIRLQQLLTETNTLPTVQADGSYSFDVAGSDLAADTAFTVSVDSTDAAGNSVTSSADSTHTVDTTAEEGTVTVNAITEDDVINASEAGETITVTGTATGGDISTGDTVTTTINGTEYSTTVQADGSYSFDVAGSDLAADTAFTVSVDSTDAAGNSVTSSADSTHTVDTTAEEGTVTVNAITEDDVINASEAGETITVTGTATGGDISTGDTVTTTINGTEYSTTVQADGSYSFDVAGSDLAADTAFTVSVDSTDAAGNSVTSSADSTHTVDTTAEEGTVTVNAITEDDVINASEAGETITVTGTATGGDISTGDTVTTTINGTEYSTTVQADGSYSFDVAGSDLAADTAFTVSVDSTDAAGNSVTSSADSTHTVDTTAEEGTVTVNAITEDDVINASEAGETITVTGTATGGDISTGDTVTATINGTEYSTTVQADGSYSFDVAGSDLAADTAFTVSVDSTDAAGNSVTSSADSTHTVDTTAEEGTVTVNAITEDDVINASEAGETITVTGTATGGDISTGDTVTTTINGTEYSTTVQADGSYSFDVAGSDLAADTAFTVSVDSTDAAGNSVTSSADSTHTVDTTAEEGTVTVNAITEDDVINASEAGETITVTGTATGGDISTGDTVTTTINGTEYSTTVQADGSYSFDVAGSDLAADTAFTVSVDSTDAAGNSVTSSADSTHTVDTTAEEGTVTVNAITEDDVINASEAGETITVTGTATGGDISTGDTVTTTINGTEYSTTVQADGSYSFDVAGSDLAADTAFTVSVDSTDAAGNSVTSTGTSTHTVDTEASAMGDLAITNIVDNSGDYSSVTMSGTGAEPGNTITVYDEAGNDVATATVEADGTWSTDITNLDGTPINDNEFFSVSETDAAGNETAQTDSTHYWHGDWSNAQTDDYDDFVMAGSGDDKINVNDDDLNDSLVVDGGEGNDTVVYSGNMSDYTITTDANGNTIVTENVSTDSDNDGIGDVTELRNVETIEFDDGSYDISTGTFTSNDLVPTATDENITVDLDSQTSQTTSVDVSGGDGHQTTNLVITLDLSGSMTNRDGTIQLEDGSTTNRLALAKESLENLINEFDGVGDVNVNLTTFSSEGTSYGWMSAEDAIDIINDLSSGGGTNYEGAVHTTASNYTEIPDADKTVALFVSDGVPTVDNDYSYRSTMLDDSYIQEWSDFVENNVDQLLVVGMGTGITDTSYLETLAVEVGDVQVNMLIIENELELNEVLIETLVNSENSVTGNLLDNLEGGDGEISLDSIEIDGVVYTDESFPSEGLQTPEGGMLTVDFTSGDYTYSASTLNFESDVTESFNVTASDEDGDSITYGFNVSIDVDDTASLPVFDLDISEAEVSHLHNYENSDTEYVGGSYSTETYDLGGTTNSVDLSFAHLNKWEEAKVELFDTQGNLVDTVFIRGDALGFNNNTYTVSSDSEFGAVKVSGENFNDDFFVTDVSATVENDLLSEVAIYSYNIDMSVGLTDTDGSESLSDITLSNIPEGAVISGESVTDNGDGTYTITPDENGDASVTLTSSSEVAQDDLNGITASVTSTEENGGDTATVSATDDSFILGDGEFELDFDTIEDGALTDINSIDMGESAHHIENIDVSDVMNMTGEDNTLTIFGQEDDVVSLDTDTWTKGEDVEVDGQTFSTFTGGGDNGLEEVQLLIDTHVTVDQS